MNYVKCVKAGTGPFSVLTQGKIYKLVEDNGYIVIVEGDDGIEREYRKTRFERIELTHKENKMSKGNWKNYEFNIRAMAQIDRDQIEEDLSASNPMMVAEVDGDPYVHVVIHESIWRKAYKSGKVKLIIGDYGTYDTHKFANKLEDLMEGEGDEYGYVPRTRLPKLIKLVRKIKKAEWQDPCKATVKVSKVKI